MKILFSLLSLLVGINTYGAILFTYNNVEMDSGKITIFRLETNGKFELLEANTVDRYGATVTNHVEGAGLNTQSLIGEIKAAAAQAWMIDGQTPVKDRKAAMRTGLMPTLIMVSWSDSFVEMRPLTEYPKILAAVEALKDQALQTGRPSNKTGIMLLPCNVGAFDDRVFTMTDPYAPMAAPLLEKVLTQEEYDTKRNGGEFNRLTGSSGNTTQGVISAMTLTPIDGRVVLKDVK